MEIFYLEKAFHAGKKIRKNDFAPSEKIFLLHPCAITHACNAANAHAQGSDRVVEAKKLLSSWRQSEYSRGNLHFAGLVQWYAPFWQFRLIRKSEMTDYSARFYKKFIVKKWRNKYKITENESRMNVHINFPSSQRKSYALNLLGVLVVCAIFWKN